MASALLNNKEKRIVVVGAGFSGLASAIALEKQLGHSNFVIIEKAFEVGGTWRENTYPGCGCDVPSHWYSLSTDWNPKWSQTYASQPEILKYLKDVTKRRNLVNRIVFGAKLSSAVWNPATHQYTCTISNLSKPGQYESIWDSKVVSEEELVVDVIISAVGGLHTPVLPDIKGFNTFKGESFHAAKWRHDVALKGKKIGVIGNGCSAAQIVPALGNDPSIQVVNFCRTPAWLVPRIQSPFSDFSKWVFASVPFIAAIYRFSHYIALEFTFLLWSKNLSWIRRIAEFVIGTYMRSQVPKEMKDTIVPKYQIGCKRIIRDPGYLKSFRKPNVNIEWEGIAEVVEDGIITKSGKKYELDIIVPCTGFSVDHTMGPPVRNKENTETMQEFFFRSGGPTAYKGTTIPGFPNLFMIDGPNTGTGHASVIYVYECQVDYTMMCLKPLLKGEVSSIEVTAEATKRHDDDMQRRIGNKVWSTCVSWYNQQGGKNVAMYPGSVTTFWASMRKPEFKDYILTPGPKAKAATNGTNGVNGKKHD